MKPLEIVIVGAGDRADCYSELALRKPEKLRIVGLVDPNPAQPSGRIPGREGTEKRHCRKDLLIAAERGMVSRIT